VASAKGTLQHTTPMIVDRLDMPGAARALERVGFDSPKHKEDFIQTLIYHAPQLLPVREIEPAFGSLLSVCTELPTPAGSIDNLYVTETGNLAIAECKLWRNPEARRQVVAQIIDYAHSMAAWSYDELQDAIRSAKTPDGNKIDASLFSLVSEDSELDEQSFIDAVSRNLRLGRILLLIVGDGIREGVETLTAYLQMHAGFHFSLGIVEMALFKLPSGGFVVQPRVLTRTVNIERGIVRLADGKVSIDASPEAEAAKARTISEEQLHEELEKAAPGVAAALRRFEETAEPLGVAVEAAAKSLQVRWRGPDDVGYALAGITPEGKLKTRNVNWKPDDRGRIDLAHEYLGKVADLIGGRVRQLENPRSWYVERKTGKFPDAIELLSRQDEWLEIIRWYTGELSKAIEVDSA
jgi:hypothetical protein